MDGEVRSEMEVNESLRLRFRYWTRVILRTCFSDLSGGEKTDGDGLETQEYTVDWVTAPRSKETKETRNTICTSQMWGGSALKGQKQL